MWKDIGAVQIEIIGRKEGIPNQTTPGMNQFPFKIHRLTLKRSTHGYVYRTQSERKSRF